MFDFTLKSFLPTAGYREYNKLKLLENKFFKSTVKITFSKPISSVISKLVAPWETTMTLFPRRRAHA